MHVAGTVSVAEVYERGVDHNMFLTLLQQILEVAEVSEASPHSVPRTVLIQHEHLTWREPALQHEMMMRWSVE